MAETTDDVRTDRRAVQAINDFLRHLRERDLPDVELFTLKARAFDLMAEVHYQEGAFAQAAECLTIADEARCVAARS